MAIKKLQKIFISLGFLSCLVTFAHSAFAFEDLRTKVKKTIQSIDPNVNAGLVILPLSDHKRQAKPDLFIHGNRFYTLASTTKLLTSIIGLKTLGPNFKFETKLYKEITPSAFNLHLQLDGDPTLTSEKITDLFINGKRKYKRKAYPDNLFITLPYNDFSPTAPGWMVGDTYYCFGAPVNHMIIDQNCIDLNDAKLKQKSDEFAVSKRAITQKRAPGHLHNYTDYKINEIRTKNKIAKRQEFLRIDPVQKKYKLISSLQSPPLFDLLDPILKDSENLPTDAIYLEMGKRQKLNQWGPVGDWVLKELSKSYQLNLDGAIMTDGSGLSRYNTLTPLQMARLLEATYYDQDIAQPLMHNLPKIGIDGSLKNRLQKSPLKGKFMGKTGTMTGVSTIAGYMTNNSQNYVVVIFMNNFTERKHRYRKLQDQLLELIYHDISRRT